MLQPEKFYNWLITENVDFFTGVPDSLLKDICAFITDNTPKKNHIIAANEGNAVALAAGYHLATKKIPLVYMQNSGLGNAVNPLLSLTDKQVYNIPLLLMIGWRGEPGVKDEPQHISQGELTPAMLGLLKIPYCILSDNEKEAFSQVKNAIKEINSGNAVYAFVVRKNTFEKYSIKTKIQTEYKLLREEAINHIIKKIPRDTIIVSTTGKTSRELFECRKTLKQPHHFDFLTVGSMGHSSQIALSIALNKPDKKIICLDGDGALLMHMGALALIGTMTPTNFIHIIINNGAHESVGGQPTVGFNIDIPAIAKANNYKFSIRVSTIEELDAAFNSVSENKCPALIEIRVKTGSRDDLGRPDIKPEENKIKFMKNLES